MITHNYTAEHLRRLRYYHWMQSCLVSGATSEEVITDVQRFLYPGQTPYTRYASGTSYLRDVSTEGDYRVPQLGRCLTLNGSSEYLSRASHPLAGHTGGFTYAAWVKLSSAGSYPTLFSSSSNKVEIRGLVNTRRMELRSFSGVSIALAANTAITLDTWTHIAACFDRDANTATMYFNGSADGTVGSIAAGNVDYGDSLHIGGRGGTQLFPGSLFDARIYSRVLTPAEIATLADWDTLGDASLLTDASLVAHYDLQGNEYDRSGNGHHLTPTGTVGTMRATDGTVEYSFPCEFGYSDGSGGVLVPRNDSDPTNDVLGNPLDYAGRAPYDGPLGGLPHIVLNGSSEYASLGSRLTTGSVTALTACCWVKTTAIVGTGSVLEEWGASGNRSWRLTIDNGYVEFRFTDNGSTNQATDGSVYVSDGVWHHVAATFDAGDVIIYVDGAEDISATKAAVTIFDGTASFGFGELNKFAASLFDARVYNATLSAADIALLAARGEPSTAPLAAWPCSERDGTTLYDVAGNNDLTITTSAIATVRGGNNTINDHNVVYGARKSSTVYIPGQLSTALAADGNALTVGRGQMPDDGTFVNRKAAAYPALVRVENAIGALNTSEEVGGATTSPNTATDTGTVRHTLTTPAE